MSFKFNTNHGCSISKVFKPIRKIVPRASETHYINQNEVELRIYRQILVFLYLQSFEFFS